MIYSCYMLVHVTLYVPVMFGILLPALDHATYSCSCLWPKPLGKSWGVCWQFYERLRLFMTVMTISWSLSNEFQVALTHRVEPIRICCENVPRGWSQIEVVSLQVESWQGEHNRKSLTSIDNWHGFESWGAGQAHLLLVTCSYPCHWLAFCKV